MPSWTWSSTSSLPSVADRMSQRSIRRRVVGLTRAPEPSSVCRELQYVAVYPLSQAN